MLRLRWLDNDLPGEPFPSAEEAMDEPNGLLAVGGDLSLTRLVTAYRNGIFPWYGHGQPILWWSPDPRAVFLPGDLHISRRLRRRLRRKEYTVTLDTAFQAVIRGCAGPRPDQEGTWITPEMLAAYCELHRHGYAHSAEVWRDGELVGGIYGIALHGAFIGESMFSRASDASKVALTSLTALLWRWGFQLFDCQMANPHLHRLGTREIPREEYLERLRAALQMPHGETLWEWDPAFDPVAEHRRLEGGA